LHLLFVKREDLQFQKVIQLKNTNWFYPGISGKKYEGYLRFIIMGKTPLDKTII
jgi:hypothetical protein